MGLSIPIALRRDLDTTLQEQIYRQVRDGILGGSFRPTLKLPSSRDLAKELGVSRNTVALAFDWLASEGYVECRTGILPDAMPDAMTVAAAAARYDVGIYPLPVIGVRSFSKNISAERALILGYSSLSPKEIVTGIGLLAKAISQLGVVR